MSELWLFLLVKLALLIAILGLGAWEAAKTGRAVQDRDHGAVARGVFLSGAALIVFGVALL